jgi:Na+/glutamate symporter
MKTAEKLHLGILMGSMLTKYGIPKTKFAEMVDKSPQELSTFINGKKELNTDTLMQYLTKMPVLMMVEYLTAILVWSVEHNQHVNNNDD